MASDGAAAAGAAAARGTLLGFLLRLLSFFLTQLTVRFVNPVTLGRASIRLELLLSTSLFIGREGFRLALTKTSASDHETDGGKKVPSTAGRAEISYGATAIESQRLNNVAWLSVPAGITLSLVALAVHLLSCERIASKLLSPPSTDDDVEEPHADQYTDQSLRDYRFAGVLYCLASMVEMLAEPIVIDCMKTLDVDSRAKAEGSAAIAKAATLVLLLSDPAGAIFSDRGLGWIGAVSESWP